MSITKYQEKFEFFIEESNKKIDTLANNFQKRLESLTQKITNAENKLNEINKRFDSSVRNSDKIDEIYTQISQKNINLCGVDNDNSIFSNINKTKIQIEDIYQKLSDTKNKIIGYRKKTRGEIVPRHMINSLNQNEYEVDGNNIYRIKYEDVPGLEVELKEKIKEYKYFLEEDEKKSIQRNKKIDQDIEALKQKIESHLPGATVAGLAFSYKNSQLKLYEEVEKWKKVFFIAIGAMILIFLHCASKQYIIFDIKDISTSIIQSLKILSFEFPFIWLAIVSSKKVTQFTRLHEEYQYKRTVAETFEGIRKVINDTENNNIQTQIDALFSSMLDSFSSNPSKTLDKKVDSDSPINSWFNFISKQDSKNEKDSNETKK